jgi:hypothetical protein
MKTEDVFYLRKDSIWAIPIIHYNMELAAQVRMAFDHIKPDCVAVELAETMQLQLLHAASRLPDISLVMTHNRKNTPLYYMCEPCDAAFEGLRCALEAQVAAWCIDLDVDFYPDVHELVPDPYAIQRIGLRHYYEIYQKVVLAEGVVKNQADRDREMYMAKRLKELSFSYDRVLFLGGMAHVESVLTLFERGAFPELQHAKREVIEVCTLSEKSCREVMSEFGWLSTHYETLRGEFEEYRQQMEKGRESGASAVLAFPPDRQKLIYQLYKEASEKYIQNTGNPFPGYHLRNIMNFLRNYALIKNRLMPDLYQILSSAKGCVDHNYAYEVWELATHYPHRHNVDGLPELDLSIEEVWGHSKIIRFHLKEKGRKSFSFQQRHKNRQFRFTPPRLFSICSYPPEDKIVERFGDFLKKKGAQILIEEAARTIPFSTSLEDGIDTKETIRHWHEKKLYVKAGGKPPGGVGSIVVIFDEDIGEEGKLYVDKFPWRTTWLGEHSQESDMAFYATSITDNIVGPGISRCEYGGFMMSYPPRRMFDVWSDPDYEECRTKAEVLLMAAIDYSTKPLITYVSSKPPRSTLKSYARRFGKKIVYIPIGQLSPVTLNKLRAFHVLEGQDKRLIADDYIF